MPLSKRIIKSEELPYHPAEDDRSPILIQPPSADVGNELPSQDEPPEEDVDRDRQAEAALEAEKEDIRLKAFQEGYGQAEEEHLRKNAGHIEQMTTLLQELSRLERDIIRESEQEILRLALAIATRILRSETRADPGYILPIIRELTDAIDTRSVIKIRLRPEDVRYLNEVNGVFLRQIDSLRNVVLEEDHTVGWGGAIIETTNGEIDARLERQLAEMEQGLLSLLQK